MKKKSRPKENKAAKSDNAQTSSTSIARNYSYNGPLWSLFGVLIGALLGFFVTQADRYIENRNERARIAKVLASDVKLQTTNLFYLVSAFENLKSGKFPEIARQSTTIDEALTKQQNKVSISIPPYNVTTFESLIPKLHVLSSEHLKDVLKFYDMLRNCEQMRQDAITVLKDRHSGGQATEAPVAEAYLRVARETRDIGRSLYLSLEKNY